MDNKLRIVVRGSTRFQVLHSLRECKPSKVRISKQISRLESSVDSRVNTCSENKVFLFGLHLIGLGSRQCTCDESSGRNFQSTGRELSVDWKETMFRLSVNEFYCLSSSVFFLPFCSRR